MDLGLGGEQRTASSLEKNRTGSDSSDGLLGLLDLLARQTLFHWADYLVLALTLAISLFIGLYYGCFGSKQKTDLEYLLANRQMKTLPVAISLIAG